MASVASPNANATGTTVKELYPTAGPSWQPPPQSAPAAPPLGTQQPGAGVFIAIGLVGAITFVIGACAAAIILIRHRRRQRQVVTRARPQEPPEELVEGAPGQVRIPVIVVLPDNRLHFGWELRPGNLEGGCGLERCPSDFFKDSQQGSEAGSEPLPSETGGSTAGGPPARRVRIRPPLVSAHVPIIDIPITEEKC